MTLEKIVMKAGIGEGDTVCHQHQVSPLKERCKRRDKAELNRPVTEH